MASYLETTPRDIHGLLSHYTHRGNWELLKGILEGFEDLESELRSINRILRRHNLRSRIRMDKYKHDAHVRMNVEDVVTDTAIREIIDYDISQRERERSLHKVQASINERVARC